ncbi:phycobilisome rod-core linker polypeptide [Synechococcus sp. CCY9201]|jgi:phycobilisome rod-core linker protein|uniref:phycobilisome rod-core linker polypeptide n=1 Tax=unclassified Synechococcus TaxID=2626047 RepID=UPI0018CD993B|nr:MULTISPECIES: phycobilisome rod-core linker polypeptide [unclassified Synechococcus]MEA5475291.1 phycobilisome rod-core linker polypeptide [Synechococcus sp. CCY9201]QPN61284.1 phycobilisome rod-core linker polypeptide [Synechococcus sp. CBW1002]
MALPLLSTNPTAINARVQGFTTGSEQDAGRLAQRLPSETAARSREEVDALIERAYQQIFFHAFRVDRDAALESRLRNGLINTRDFIRGLLLSQTFRDGFYRCNSNYRVVEQMVGRVLGRPVHGQQEQIALSILIAEQGLPGLIDTLLDSQEYLEAFGLDEVPYQRNRVLPGRAIGAIPFNQQAPRYDQYWREATNRRAPAGGLGSGARFSGEITSPSWKGGKPPEWAQRLWLGLAAVGALEVGRVLLTTAGAMLSTGP